MIEGFVHGCRKAEQPSVNSLICNYNYNTKLYTYNQEEKTLTLSLGTEMMVLMWFSKIIQRDLAWR